ncbi:MAG: metallophosphoesterase family protein [Chloroflexi bacterium]|nr:metallophosphoesterase family protein [Chloroflexota bacterium]
MRLAVFGDIHGNLTALDAALDDMKRAGAVDLLWCLGDLAALGGGARECIRRLSALREELGKDKFKVIGGNTDRYLVTGERFPMSPPQEEAEYAAYRDNILSMSAIYEWNMAQLAWDDFQLLNTILGRELRQRVEGYGMVIGVHAIPGDDEGMSLRPDSSEEEAADALLDRQGRLALCGHTHLAMDREVGGWRVINPGSVGLSFSNPGLAEWALLEWKDGALEVQLRTVPYDVEAALRQWEASGYPRIDWIRGRIGV